MISGPILLRRASRAWIAAVFAAVAFAASCRAADGEGTADAWGVQQLMAELGRVQQSHARFVEHKYLKVLQTPLELTGTLVYTAPDRLVKRTVTPKPETMTVEGGRLVIERNGRARTLRLEDYPVLWGFVESIRATLKGDLPALDRFYRVALEGGPPRWTLSLTPKDAKMRTLVDGIVIGGGKGRIGSVEVNEANGDRSVMQVTEDTP
jgi:Outer membrane lipoprotein carrier protein LolA-like